MHIMFAMEKMMVSRFRSWWQKAKKPLEVFGIIVVCVLGTALIVAIGQAYIFHVNVPGLSGKDLWDWLQLIFIPAVLTFGAIWYTARQNHDLQITLDNQRETALQTYLDKMSELLLHENLRQSKLGDDVRNIAHARTLTVLPKLDPNRKRSIILFLAESGLIERNKWIIDMSFSDLRGVNLSHALKLDSIALDGADLQGANLSGAELTRVNFCGVNLHHANLSGTNLWEADLTEANLKGVTGITVERLKKQAKSLKGAIMPDGTIHA